MSPSPPKEVSLPSLPDMKSSASGSSKKDAASSSSATAPGTSSSISSDLSTTSNDQRNASATAEGQQWYYYLNPRAASRLPHYKYDGADLSLLYKYVLSPLAAWCVDNLTPTWVAPNAITLFGLAWMILSYCVVWFYCPGLYEANVDLQNEDGSAFVRHAVPPAIFLLNGCAMLIYQTLDNMDGKQARKTGSSSPLGLLFDHGCDAMNTILGSANWMAAMAMIPGNVSDLLGNDNHGNIQGNSLLSEFFGGDAILAALLILSPMIAFYITTWEQYYTGKLVLPPFNGPSEGLLMGASLSIASFFLGPMFWQGTSLADGAIEKIGSFEWMNGRVRNMDLVVLASVIALVQEVTLKMLSVAHKYGLGTLRTILPNMMLTASALTLVHLDPMLFLRSPRVMMHLISGLFTEQTTQLMLDHMVEEEYKVGQRWSLFPFTALAVWMASGYPISSGHLDTILLVYSSGLWVYLAFKIRVQVYEICDVLGIWCFDIVTPYPKKVSMVGDNNLGANVAKKTN